MYNWRVSSFVRYLDSHRPSKNALLRPTDPPKHIMLETRLVIVKIVVCMYVKAWESWGVGIGEYLSRFCTALDDEGLRCPLWNHRSRGHRYQHGYVYIEATFDRFFSSRNLDLSFQKRDLSLQFHNLESWCADSSLDLCSACCWTIEILPLMVSVETALLATNLLHGVFIGDMSEGVCLSGRHVWLLC